MPRLARLKVDESDAWYHVCARVAAKRGEYPIEETLCQQTFVRLLKHYSSIYFCDVAGFCVMGNHYHVVLRFEGPRLVESEELERRAKRLYPGSSKELKAWTSDQWKRLEERLFNLSELMRNLQAAFARWYNRTYDRRGRFWAERFKSTLLENGEAVLDCLLYIELNPVRAGLVVRPEEYTGSSCALRHAKADRWMLKLSDIVGHRDRKRAMLEYRSLLYLRGNVPSKEGQMSIPDEVLAAEAARGYEVSGVFARRLRCFTDGLAVGCEGFVREVLGQLREAGRFKRRKNPTAQIGVLMSVREQRGNAVGF